MRDLQLNVRTAQWRLKSPFRISRGVKTHAETIIVELTDGTHVGRGECTPYARYGESVESVGGQIKDVQATPDCLANSNSLQNALPPGAARNALDCALLDLEAKASGVRTATRFGLQPIPVTTAYTLSLDSPEAMFEAARAAASRPLLKIKLGSGPEDEERLRSVRRGAPDSRLIVDANEGWSENDLDRNLAIAVACKVALIEQPLPADGDEVLERFSSPIPLCADESVHTREDLDRLARRYSVINVKLDKTGGLTEAMALISEARARDLTIMVGCMVASSLAMAPAVRAAQGAAFVDLDGPLLLAEDFEPALRFDGSLIDPPDPALWG
ncbi:MAG: N-acetyl-D-Glu racemase DgcA [Pseudomonadota bacterium]